MPSGDHPFTEMVLHYGMKRAGCVHRSKIPLLPILLQQTELWSFGFTVPLYLKAKSQGGLKEYDIHQDLRL
jgi:hypothetical protein